MKFNVESQFNLAADKRRERSILESFSPEQQEEIQKKLDRLSLIPKYIGQDFDMPVELNTPGGGWHWDFEHNVVRVDPRDILEKPIEYLKFVMAHEGGHRRVSRVDFIPKEVWNQQGFPFMMNAIEDPRMNNFVAAVDPVFKEHMEFAYAMDIDFETEQREQAQEKLGFQPRFMQAGLEYIKQWFHEVKEKEFEISEGLPDDVRSVVEQTLHSAQDSWLRYPTREEADSSEEMITAYAKKSYEINRDEVWPLFKTLVEQDTQDQKTQELLQEMMDQQEQSESGGEGSDQENKETDIPQDLKDTLSEEEQKELEEAIEQAQQANADKNSGEGLDSDEGQGGGEQIDQEGQPVDFESLSESLKQKIKDYIDSLPQEQQQELEQKAREALEEFEKDLNDALENKFTEESEENKKLEESFKEKDGEHAEEQDIDTKDLKNDIRSIIEKDKTSYDTHYEKVVPLINTLTNDLRNIFRERKKINIDSGFRRGKSINVSTRIREVASDIPTHKTRSFEKKTLPSEKDYAISLLVDLSGSMRGEKIEETFKAAIILVEVLNRLSIKTEIIGFNDRLHEFQKYGENFSKDVREKMGIMLQEVESKRAAYNDDGWALQQTSERLEKQQATQKFIIILSDGKPVESPQHGGSQYDLHESVKKITGKTDQKLIGLGLLSTAVAEYYPNNISGITIEEVVAQISPLLKSIIENPHQY